MCIPKSKRTGHHTYNIILPNPQLVDLDIVSQLCLYLRHIRKHGCTTASIDCTVVYGMLGFFLLVIRLKKNLYWFM